MNAVKLARLMLIVVLLPVLAFAQQKQDTNVDMAKALTKPGAVNNIIGLFGLDPNKFSMSHSYSFSIGSFGGETFNQGLYLNTMTYQFSDPLKMYFQFGVQHQPLGSQQFQNQAQAFISGAGLQYKPTDNLSLQFEFSQTPSNNYYPGYYRNPFKRKGLFDQRRSLFDEENTNNK